MSGRWRRFRGCCMRHICDACQIEIAGMGVLRKPAVAEA